MEFTGHIVGIAKELGSRVYRMTLELDEETTIQCVQNLEQNTKMTIKISKWYKKRSKDANAYLWVLCDKLAGKLNTSKDEVYEEMLRSYGTFYTNDDGHPTSITVLSKVDMSKIEGHWKYYSKTPDGKFKVYLMIKGSSQYDISEMSKLLNGVISECKEQGIYTEPDFEIREMLERWGEQYAKAHKRK